MSYASKTTVSPEKSRAEIENLIRKFGCTAYQSGYNSTAHWILFVHKERMVRFTIPMPSPSDPRFQKKGLSRVKPAIAVEQEIKALWRRLLLCIMAKLEAVESGIETFEEAFMPHIVMPNGETFSEVARSAIAQAYESKSMPKLLALMPATGEKPS